MNKSEYGTREGLSERDLEDIKSAYGNHNKQACLGKK
jgi:hypothetical protein